MKTKKYESIKFDWYGSYEYYHRIDGPAYIGYKTSEKKKIVTILHYLYNKEFCPWWIA